MTGFSRTVRGLIQARSDGYCEICDCAEIETLHHRRSRGDGGSSLPWVNQAANGLGVCEPCHAVIEGRVDGSSRIRSTEAGWLISLDSGAMADGIALMYRGRRALLTDGGNVTYIVDIGDAA